MSPLSERMRRQMASSGRFLPLPSALTTAMMSEVNSCPLGMPRNFTPVSSPFLSSSNSSLPVRLSAKETDSCPDVEQKSSTKAFISAACSLASSAATRNSKWFSRAPKMPLSCSMMFESNTLVLLSSPLVGECLYCRFCVGRQLSRAVACGLFPLRLHSGDKDSPPLR